MEWLRLLTKIQLLFPWVTLNLSIKGTQEAQKSMEQRLTSTIIKEWCQPCKWSKWRRLLDILSNNCHQSHNLSNLLLMYRVHYQALAVYKCLATLKARDNRIWYLHLIGSLAAPPFLMRTELRKKTTTFKEEDAHRIIIRKILNCNRANATTQSSRPTLTIINLSSKVWTKRKKTWVNYWMTCIEWIWLTINISRAIKVRQNRNWIKWTTD